VKHKERKYPRSINTKSQASNPKQIPITNHPNSKQEKNRAAGLYPVSIFGFRIFITV